MTPEEPAGTRPVAPASRTWHRRFLAAGAGGLVLAVPLCYLFLFAAIPAAACFVLSLAAAIAYRATRRGPDTARDRFVDGLTTVAALLGTGGLLTILANTELYVLWLVLAALLILESAVLAPPWRGRGAAQLAVLVAALVVVPLGVAARRPSTVWSAILRNDLWHLRLLLAGGADPDRGIDADPLLGLALGHGTDVRLVRMLLASGANPNARLPSAGNAPLLVGATGASAQAVEAMLDAGADPNATDAGGRTAVFAATTGGNRETLELLARRGAKLDARDASGRTPLFEASSRDTAELLLRLGVDPQATDAQGRSPLFVAVTQWGPVAGLFVERGLSVNSRDKRGRTPLFAISEHRGGAEDYHDEGGHGYRMATWLVVSGADPGIRDDDGKTAADVAETGGHAALAALLRAGPSTPPTTP